MYRGCYFLTSALEHAQNKAAAIKEAERVGCSGQCTLENGCVLYKNLRDTSETELLQKLRSELIYHMLGE